MERAASTPMQPFGSIARGGTQGAMSRLRRFNRTRVLPAGPQLASHCANGLLAPASDDFDAVALLDSGGCLDLAFHKLPDIAHRNGEIVLTLQVDPELRRIAEITPEAQCGFGRDRALPVQDVNDTA
jgi:hypothetical protein